MRLWWTMVALALLGGVACKKPKQSLFTERYFTHWDDRRVLCSMGADRTHRWTLDDLRAALDRAAVEHAVLHTYGHAPTFDLDEYLPLFAYAKAHGVDMVTYAELADRTNPRPGWAFSIDDHDVETWMSWRDKLRAAGVHLTFFVDSYDTLGEAQRAQLHQLVADGHDVEVHGVHHLEAVKFAEQRGAAAYAAEEVAPELAEFARDGFSTKAFAYPFGHHTPALDAVILPLVRVIRGASSVSCY